MSFTNTLTRYDAALVELIARRPELRDVGIAGYLVGAAVDGAPGMPATYACDCGLCFGSVVKAAREVAA
jgi:hypothetical protein